MSESNPLIHWPERPFRSFPFADIKQEHFKPAFENALKKAKENLEKYNNNQEEANFDNTMLALEAVDEDLQLLASVFFNLLGTEGDEEMHKMAQEFSPLLAEFENDVTLDPKIFERVRKLYDSRQEQNLDSDQLRLVEHSYRGFVRNGALLDENGKKRLREIDAEMAKLMPKFSENVLKATNAFELHVTDDEVVKDIPENALAEAKELAKEKGHDAGYVFTLQAPSFVPFLTYCHDSSLREKVWTAYATRCHGGEFDNGENIQKIVSYRKERAKLLGYESHAQFVLEERMAKTPTRVQDFLQKLTDASWPAAQRDYQQLQKEATDSGLEGEAKIWDLSYYREKLKKKLFDFDEQQLRPYFPLQQVLDGIFIHAEKLYDIKFEKRDDVDRYHEDVQVFEVKDTQGAHVGLFYADFFPRKTKRPGAWMSPLIEQGILKGENQRPHISIVCNFSKPTADKPALLSFDEVLTLFHEFGHALHGLLSDCRYRSQSGTNVAWDFVELPSQIFENWVYEKESLELFAKHFESGDSFPEELRKKILDARTFMAGFDSIRQLRFGMIDMAWHTLEDPSAVKDVEKFEVDALKKYELTPHFEGACFSCAFSHVFSGGYSSGYYSYKWSEVLDADAFEYFKEKGVFNADVAKSFKDNILSKGDTSDPMELYKKFRGREPDINALLRRQGLTSA